MQKYSDWAMREQEPEEKLLQTPIEPIDLQLFGVTLLEVKRCN